MPPKKSLGQHWLTDETSLEAMLTAAEVSTSDTVLEIGPGLGSLTRELVRRASKVVAVEKDEQIAASLPAKIASERLEVVTDDILQFDPTSLPVGYKIVANIPYYLTSNLIRILSESSNPPSIASLLVQKEVAERLAARSGDMSVLAVTTQFYWEVSLGRIVKAELFEPPPKIDSQIVKLTRLREKPFDVNEKLFFHLVKAGFSQKRKTLTNNLAASYHMEKSEAAGILERAAINPSARAQTLSLADWYRLFQSLKS